MTGITLLNRGPYDNWRWAEERFTARDYLGAAKVLEELLADETNVAERAQVRELLARSYYHSARLGPAADLAREILADEPDNGYVALLLSRTLQRQNDRAGAEVYRRRAAALGVEE